MCSTLQCTFKTSKIYFRTTKWRHTYPILPIDHFGIEKNVGNLIAFLGVIPTPFSNSPVWGAPSHLEWKPFGMAPLRREQYFHIERGSNSNTAHHRLCIRPLNERCKDTLIAKSSIFFFLVFVGTDSLPTVCFLDKWPQTKCKVTFDTSFW